MTLLEFRKGKPRPNRIYWYTGTVDKDGAEGNVLPLFRHPIEIVSWPVLPEKQGGPVRVFARHTPGNPLTAGWVNLDSIGGEILNPEPPRG